MPRGQERGSAGTGTGTGTFTGADEEGDGRGTEGDEDEGRGTEGDEDEGRGTEGDEDGEDEGRGREDEGGAFWVQAVRGHVARASRARRRRRLGSGVTAGRTWGYSWIEAGWLRRGTALSGLGSSSSSSFDACQNFL